jgi:hypothetical protein
VLSLLWSRPQQDEAYSPRSGLTMPDYVPEMGSLKAKSTSAGDDDHDSHLIRGSNSNVQSIGAPS